MNRRQFTRTIPLALAGSLLTGAMPHGHKPPRPRRAMGVTPATYAVRWRSDTPSTRYPGLQSALDILEDCVRLGAGGAQVGVGNWASDFAGSVRDRRETLGLYLEGQIHLPDELDDLAVFEREVIQAKEAGASVLRAVCMGGRRYEAFRELSEFQSFKESAWRAVERVEPVVRRHQVRLALENHKDWRAEELVDLIHHIGSPWIGVTLDLGNNLALLEDPMEVVRRLAPLSFTTHIKDMGVAPYDEGFLLSEVPLGEGMLDLSAMVEVCERHNPDITFNLEMITRDPLRIPCLTDAYWATFDRVAGRELARSLRLVADHPPRTPLPTVAGKSPEEQLALEDAHNVRSFTYARDVLGMGAR